jgi:DNA-binding response OmpR family regulator
MTPAAASRNRFSPWRFVVPNILVVDDDPSVRQMVCDILEFEGHATRGAADGFEALAAIDSERPDCLILDLMMPGLSGHEVLTRIREADGGAHLPVVMLTAAGDDAESWKAWTGGVDYFLAKPFDSDQLLRFLEYLFSPSGAVGAP